MLIATSRRLEVYAYSAPVDMRKGFDGLAALVREGWGRDPTNGALYLFVSRNRIRAKVLMWDGTGLCLYSKRLEQGRFAPLWRRGEGAEVTLSATELALYLEGSEEVGRRRLSPPEIDPNRKILGELCGNLSPCSTSNPSTIQASCAPCAEPTRPRTEYWSTASRA